MLSDGEVETMGMPFTRLSVLEDTRVKGNGEVERVRERELWCLRSLDVILWGHAKETLFSSDALGIQVVGVE